MTRKSPIFDIPVRLTEPLRPLEQLIESLKRAIGRTTSLLDVTMLYVNGGLGTVGASGAGTALASTRTSIDFSDMLVDQARIVVYASNSSANQRQVQVYDTTNSIVIAQVDIANTAQVYQGTWTSVAFKGGERAIEVRVIGNGAETQTVHNVHLQLRTTHVQQR